MLDKNFFCKNPVKDFLKKVKDVRREGVNKNAVVEKIRSSCLIATTIF